MTYACYAIKKRKPQPV